MAKLRSIIKARYLRKGETKEEKILWKQLRNRNLGIKFRRQHPIEKFIIDFYAPEIKLAIELDGYSHKGNSEYDNLRTEYLKSQKIKVIRFWNTEIEKNLDKVIEKIKENIGVPPL
ncbi:MAG: DUF559 domain-containing protein [Candidatus Paceibacterota bacterium]